MNDLINRRTLLLAAASSGFASAGARHAFARAELPTVAAYRNPGCGCCENWSNLLKAAGFKITMSDDPNLARRRQSLGIPESVAGCHLALIGRYMIEGHVPVEDIFRLLSEQPDAMGLAVPGMPSGSPGMETGGEVEKYSVLIFNADGTSKVYSQH